MKDDNPCHGCEERWVVADRSCHGVCERYFRWRAKLDAENEVRRAAAKARNDADNFAIESVERTKRKQSCYKKS